MRRKVNIYQRLSPFRPSIPPFEFIFRLPAEGEENSSVEKCFNPIQIQPSPSFSIDVIKFHKDLSKLTRIVSTTNVVDNGQIVGRTKKASKISKNVGLGSLVRQCSATDLQHPSTSKFQTYCAQLCYNTKTISNAWNNWTSHPFD